MGEHPWAAFLAARLRCIAWMLDEGKSEEEILHTLSMDPGQVKLLVMTIYNQLRSSNQDGKEAP